MKTTPFLGGCLTVLVALGALASVNAEAQSVRVDTTPAHAISFDPDLALGTSVDILQANRRYDELIAWLAPNIRPNSS